MGLIPVKTPNVVRTLFPNYIWRMSAQEKVIYLTFDDGPTPGVTDNVLATLQAFKAKATFFCIGRNVDNYPELFKRILEHGHAIGNHTHHHLKGWNSRLDEYLEDTLKAQTVIDLKSNLGSKDKPKLFRPPYGKLTKKQGRALRENQYKIVMWDVLSFDWKATISSQHCAQNVINHANNGSIVVFHDSLKARKHMIYALPKVLEHFSARGYTFKSLAAI